ncbi:hypothetical protein GCM10025864_05750 [Luteimicrobium album]|uniref:Uncharacterized protein n=1 Tax=Luteimicrobium album TaxID=1054550 RepID=A0ABQ6HXR8_9MICO|nr:hypothetical protein [Luteimicrobium album]GMA22816.1 hypothetical protein GCM10025864_05750 [Luteimicrobium album]
MTRFDELPAEQQAELVRLGEGAADVFEKSFSPDSSHHVPPLIALRQVRYQRSYLERRAAELVAEARAEGISWHQVGVALGTTGEAARRRYSAA